MAPKAKGKIVKNESFLNVKKVTNKKGQNVKTAAQKKINPLTNKRIPAASGTGTNGECYCQISIRTCSERMKYNQLR